jgi:hypothetical protein
MSFPVDMVVNDTFQRRLSSGTIEGNVGKGDGQTAAANRYE